MRQQKNKSNLRERLFGLWLPLAIICLFVGGFWIGYQQVEAQKRADTLVEALRHNNPAAVQRALNQGANPNARCDFNALPLGILAIVKQLFWNALHPTDGGTALSLAVQMGNPQIVQMLLNHGALPNLRNPDGSTALMSAAEIHFYGTPANVQPGIQKQIHLMQMLLDKGADVKAKSQDGSTALTFAVRDGFNGTIDLTVPRFLLAHGADANAEGFMGQTLLQWSVGGQDKRIVPFVGLLLDHGANVNAEDSLGGTPIMRASEWIDPAMVQMLLRHGANPNPHSPANDMTPLIQAARQGQIGSMKILLDKGADVNAFSQCDSTALFVAAQHKRADMVKLLLEHGANPNYINAIEMCEPALTVAAYNNDVPSVKLLLAHGANANLAGDDGMPLTAAANGCLVQSYAKRHNNIWDPGDVAGILPVSPPGGIAVTQMLLAAGADANGTDQAGNTALVYAVAGHNAPLVRMLMAHGANPWAQGANRFVPDSAAESPLSLATQRGYSDLIPLLQKNSHQ